MDLKVINYSISFQNLQKGQMPILKSVIYKDNKFFITSGSISHESVQDIIANSLMISIEDLILSLPNDLVELSESESDDVYYDLFNDDSRLYPKSHNNKTSKHIQIEARNFLLELRRDKKISHLLNDQ